jgi:hypothetical protein
MLAQYHDATGDEVVFGAVERSLRALASKIEQAPLYNWGRYRWFEGLIPTYHVYQRTGEPWLMELAHRLREQGFDYAAFYRGEDVTSPTPPSGTTSNSTLTPSRVIVFGSCSAPAPSSRLQPEVKIRVDSATRVARRIREWAATIVSPVRVS